MTADRQSLCRAIVLLAPLLIGAAGPDARLSWTMPSTYSDGTPIPPEEVRRIVVKVFAGPASDGPWKWVATSEPGAASVAVPSPGPWETRWYTASATLDGRESGYAEPLRKTNLSILLTPGMKKILKKAMAMKRWIFLSLLVLLAGLAGYIRYRGSRAKGR